MESAPRQIPDERRSAKAAADSLHEHVTACLRALQILKYAGDSVSNAGEKKAKAQARIEEDAEREKTTRTLGATLDVIERVDPTHAPVEGPPLCVTAATLKKHLIDLRRLITIAKGVPREGTHAVEYKTHLDAVWAAKNAMHRQLFLDQPGSVHAAVKLADLLSDVWRACASLSSARKAFETAHKANAGDVAAKREDQLATAQERAAVAIEAALAAIEGVDPSLVPVQGPRPIEIAADMKPVLLELWSVATAGALDDRFRAQVRAVADAQRTLRGLLFAPDTTSTPDELEQMHNETSPAVALTSPSERTCTSILIELVGLVRRQREIDPRITGTHSAPWRPPQPSESPAWELAYNKIEALLVDLDQEYQKISAKNGPFAQDPYSQAVARLRATFAEWRTAWALTDSTDESSLDDRIGQVEINWASLAAELAKHDVPHFDPATEEGTKDSLHSVALSADVVLLTNVRREAAERLWKRALRLRQTKPHLPSLPPGVGDPKQVVLGLKDWVVSAHGADWERRHKRPRHHPEKARVIPTPSPITEPAEIIQTLRAMENVPKSSSLYETAGSLLINAARKGALDDYPEAVKLIRVQAARPGGQNFVGAWNDGVFEIRKQRGLAGSLFFESFGEDLVLVADIIETSISARGSAAADPVHTNAGSFQPGDTKPPLVAHADDFTWVIWFGTRYAFSKGNQAECVRHLWESWEKSGRRDGCGLSEKTLGVKVDSANDHFRIVHVFRKHEAWGKMIRMTEQRGVYALFAGKN